MSTKGMTMVSGRFEKILEKELTGEKLSHIFMCGPNKMSSSLIKAFEQKSMPNNCYTII